jgi:hypothetical protein
VSPGRSFIRALIVLLTIGVCTISVSSPTTLEVPVSTTVALSPTISIEGCDAPPLTDANLLALDPAQLSILVSQTAFACSTEAVVASGDSTTLLAAAQLAAAAGAPLLLADDDPSPANQEIQRLGTNHIYTVGLVNADPNADTDVTRLTESEALEETAELLGGVPLVGATGSASLGRTGVALLTGVAVVDGPWVPEIEADAIWLAGHAPNSSTVWLGDGTRPEYVAPVLAAAAARNESVLLVDPSDLRRLPATVGAYRAMAPTVTVLVGSIDEESVSWQLPALTSAAELPGGGLTFFPGRRVVALYGNPTTSALGVLGEQGPEESVARVAEISAGYDADGIPILPGFEIIATVASSSAGADSDYSEEMSLDLLRPWIDVAADQDVYVILDLQPGRTDFLTQAKRYEEFLRLPHVGLALDPEWRLEPNQVHLRQIGSVDAAEINAVADWLASVVRAENLPQKFFLLHQFRLDMITNRDQVRTPPELAVVVQMDGQGPLSTKYDTWAALIAGSDDAGFSWGWKNFYDEDTPRGGATAEQVLELEPVPVYVSFQ